MRSRQWAVVLAVAIVAGAGVGFAAGRLTAPSPSPPPNPDHAAEIDVTILCETSTPCNVTFLVDRAAKWTLIGGCPSAPCSLQPISTAPRWTGEECEAFLAEAESQLTDNTTITLCDGEATNVTLSAEGIVSVQRFLGISIVRSADGTNWTLIIAAVSPGLTTSDARLTIVDAGGAIDHPAEAFSSLSYSLDGAVFAGDGDSPVEVTERLLLSTFLYPTGYRVEITDSQGFLFAGSLL